MKRTQTFYTRIDATTPTNTPIEILSANADNILLQLGSGALYHGKPDFLSMKMISKNLSAQSLPFTAFNIPIFQGFSQISQQNTAWITENPRLNLLFYHSDAWLEIGQIPVVNNSGTEWLLFDLLQYYCRDGALSLSSEDKLGISLTKALNGGDKCEIWGGVTEEFTPPQMISNTQSARLSDVSITDSSSIILLANTSRIKALFVNAGNSNIYLAFSTSSSPFSYSIKCPPNYMMIEEGYKGIISASCAAGEFSALQITEVST